MKNWHTYTLAVIFFVPGLARAADPVTPLKAAGIVEPFFKVTVGSRATGIVDSVAVEEGAKVKEGDVLAKLDDKKDQYEVDHQVALETLWRVKAAASETLQKQGIDSKDKYNEAKASAEVAAAQLHIAQKMLQDKTVRAPLSGIVTRRFKLPGESVQEREDLFEIIKVDTVYFLAYLDAKDLLRVREGQPAKVHLDVYEKESFSGKVYFVDPAVDAGSGQFRVRVLLENSQGRVKAGLKGMVTLEEESPHVSISR